MTGLYKGLGRTKTDALESPSENRKSPYFSFRRFSVFPCPAFFPSAYVFRAKRNLGYRTLEHRFRRPDNTNRCRYNVGGAPVLTSTTKRRRAHSNRLRLHSKPLGGKSSEKKDGLEPGVTWAELRGDRRYPNFFHRVARMSSCRPKVQHSKNGHVFNSSICL